MIPELTDGVLPEGIHSCTMAEIERTFGQFRRTDRRPKLTAKLKAYVEAARAAGVAVAVIIDGSYVSAKEEPGDIDLLLVLKHEVDLAEDLRPAEYNVLSKRMVRKLYGFDVIPAVEGEQSYETFTDFFMTVKATEETPYTGRQRKGVLRIEL